MTTNAIYVTTITVTDPDTNGDVEMEVYKDEQSGGMFAIDSSFLDQAAGDEIPSPFSVANTVPKYKHYMVKLINLDRARTIFQQQ